MDHLTSIMANNKFRDEKQGTDLSRTVKKVKVAATWFLVAFVQSHPAAVVSHGSPREE